MQTSGHAVWLRAEEHRLRLEHPRVWRALRWMARRRLPILVGLAALTGGVLAQIWSDQDAHLFAVAARRLLSGDAFSVFADPTLQVGPLYLLLLGLVDLVPAVIHLPPYFVSGAVQSGVLVWATLRIAQALAPPDEDQRVIRDLGLGTALLFGPIAASAVNGHFEEPLVAVLLLLTALHARGGDGRAALWLAAAAGLKLWGVLGLPVLLLGARRSLARRLEVFAAAVAAMYLPFFLWGSVRTFELAWTVLPSAPLGFFLTGTEFTWKLRVLQAVVVCLTAGAVALRHGIASWTVPTAVIATRLLLDPKPFEYYWAALVLCLLVGLWSTYASRWAVLWPCSAIGAFLAIALPFLVGITTARVVHTVVLLAVLLYVATLRRAGTAVPDIRPTVSAPAG